MSGGQSKVISCTAQEAAPGTPTPATEEPATPAAAEVRRSERIRKAPVRLDL